MELVNGGEMFETIKNSGSYSGKIIVLIIDLNLEETAKLLFT